MVWQWSWSFHSFLLEDIVQGFVCYCYHGDDYNSWGGISIKIGMLLDIVPEFQTLVKAAQVEFNCSIILEWDKSIHYQI